MARLEAGRARTSREEGSTAKALETPCILCATSNVKDQGAKHSAECNQSAAEVLRAGNRVEERIGVRERGAETRVERRAGRRAGSRAERSAGNAEQRLQREESWQISGEKSRENSRAKTGQKSGEKIEAKSAAPLLATARETPASKLAFVTHQYP